MNSETPSAASNNQTLLTYSVLTGLTPLIPVPLADDLLKSYFKRRLVRALAAAHDLNLDEEVVRALAADERGGCLGGCLAQAVLYPLKKIFRKIFYFLEWKRAADLTSHTYHYGYLLDYVFRQGQITPDPQDAARILAAIEKTCREAPIKPIESAVATTFRQSKSALVSAASLAEKGLRQVSGKSEKIEQEIEAVETKEREEVRGLVENLRQKIGGIPEAHFEDLRRRFSKHLTGG